jgi:hypothetical protein
MKYVILKNISQCLQIHLKLNNYNQKCNHYVQNTEQRGLVNRKKSCSIKFKTILP